jgi:hypothetical protein
MNNTELRIFEALVTLREQISDSYKPVDEVLLQQIDDKLSYLLKKVDTKSK